METNDIMPHWNQVEEVELVYRTKVKASQRPKIASVKALYELLLEGWNKDKIDLLEEFKVVYMNNAHKVLSVSTLSQGGVSATVADPKIIFATALKRNASVIALAHNHPSGNIKPSRHDEAMTSKLKQGAAFLDITILDHIIISSEGYFSFADEGLL